MKAKKTKAAPRKKARRVPTCPLDLRLLVRACLGRGCVPSAFLSEAMAADAVAAAALKDVDPQSPIWYQADRVAVSIGHSDDYSANARKFIAHYFEVTGEECTSPEDAAEEIIGGLSWPVQEAAFLLGVCVARRLIRAAAGGHVEGRAQ